MREKLNLTNRNPICNIATVRDHLLLHGYKLPSELIYLSCISSLMITGRMLFQNVPLFFIGPVENAIDKKLFARIGFDMENINLDSVLRDMESENIIAHFDYYSLVMKNAQIKRYNLCPIHSTLIIEADEKDTWCLNEIEYDMQENTKIPVPSFVVRPTEKIIKSNIQELFPFSTHGCAYKVIPSLKLPELEKRLNDIVKSNLKKMIDEAKVLAPPIIDEGVTLYYGLQSYNQFLKEIDSFRVNCNEIFTAEDAREFGIKLMVLRRFLLPASGAGDFFRTELAEAFQFYGKYTNNDRFYLVVEELVKTSNCWKKLAPMLNEIVRKKEKINALNDLYELVSEIKNNEIMTISKLEDAMTP